VDKQEIIRRMCESGVLPVFRTRDVRHIMPASKAYCDAGIGCIEYTMTVPGALDLIRQAVAELGGDMCVGAGTALDGASVDRAVEAGAKFVASPGLNAGMVEACRRHGVVSVVGAITPTEIMEAMDLGADVIKVFPAGCVGPGFFAEMLGPFPGLCLMAAAGFTLATVGQYVAAGASIVTVPAQGLDAAAYAAGDCPAITRAAVKWVQAVRAARPRR